MRYLLGELFSHLHSEIVRNLFFFKSFTKENFDRKHSFRTLSSFGEEINRHHGGKAIIREFFPLFSLFLFLFFRESIFYFNIEGFNYFAARKFSEYPETSDRFKAISSWKKAAEEVQRQGEMGSKESFFQIYVASAISQRLSSRNKEFY